MCESVEASKSQVPTAPGANSVRDTAFGGADSVRDTAFGGADSVRDLKKYYCKDVGDMKRVRTVNVSPTGVFYCVVQ